MLLRMCSARVRPEHTHCSPLNYNYIFKNNDLNKLKLLGPTNNPTIGGKSFLSLP